MPRMTIAERIARNAERTARDNRIAAAQVEAYRVVQTGVCPQCGAKLRSNQAILGWWQCQQYGAVGFRADSNLPSCSFQCFTE